MKALRVLGTLLLVACGSRTETTRASAEEHGRALFSDPLASPSQSNAFACSTCHGESSAERLFPGGSLGGVVTRPSFWGGREDDLLRSMNDCRTAFMDAPSPWSRDEDPALAMYAYLASLPGPAQPVPVSLVEPPIADLPGGDPSAGTVVYERACRTCHGALHDGQGRRGAFIPVLPEEVIAQHASLNLSPAATRAVFIQKMRRGNADVPGQSMPPFSREVLSDQDISGLLALFGL